MTTIERGQLNACISSLFAAHVEQQVTDTELVERLDVLTTWERTP